MESDAPDRVFVGFKNVKIADLFFERRAGAFDQFFSLNRILSQLQNIPHVFLQRFANLLILICINERSDSLIGKQLREQCFVDTAVDYVDTRNTRFACDGSVLRF